MTSPAFLLPIPSQDKTSSHPLPGASILNGGFFSLFQWLRRIHLLRGTKALRLFPSGTMKRNIKISILFLRQNGGVGREAERNEVKEVTIGFACALTLHIYIKLKPHTGTYNMSLINK